MPKTSPRIIVAGNWKMNPSTLREAKKLFLDIRKGIGRRKQNVEIVVAPPYPFISEMERLSPSKRITLAAQDVFYEASGAHTGEVSISMLKSVGASWVIVGHSERRARGEDNQEIYRDLQTVIKTGALGILCVGEHVRDRDGQYLTTVEEQIHTALKNVPKSKLKHVVIAYEPIWAIGTGKTATPADAHEMKIFIQKVLSDIYDRKTAMKVKILYGGSVKKDNAAALLTEGQVDGFLVGGASLKAKEFVTIINTAHEYSAALTK